MTVDNNPGSRFADRIYLSWTTFADDGTGYIYQAHSSDYGESFSDPVLVSADSGLCGNTFGLPTPQGRCNENQDSQPFTAPDGTLYIVYNNFNNTVTGTDNRNQVLLARSTDGGETFSAPVKVADYYELPDCDTYQGAGADPGRACVPETGPSSNSVFRASNYPIGGVDPTNPNRVVVTFGSYINRDSNEHRGCTPAGFAADGINIYTGVKTGGCNNDILYSVSTDRAGSFSGTVIDPRQLPVVTDGAKQSSTDQFWQAATLPPTAPSSPPTTTGPTATTTPPGTPTSPCPRPTTGPPSRTAGPPPHPCPRRPSSPAPSTATTPASPSPREGLPDLVRHPHPRRVPLPRHRDTGQPTDHLHRIGTQRTLRQRPRHLPHRCTNPLMPHSWARAFPCS